MIISINLEKIPFSQKSLIVIPNVENNVVKMGSDQ
jgi:hypothetical protein